MLFAAPAQVSSWHEVWVPCHRAYACYRIGSGPNVDESFEGISLTFDPELTKTGLKSRNAAVSLPAR
jgi:hypothetical protein